MKTLKLISFFTLLFSLLVTVRCSEEDARPLTLGTLSGAVTYPNTLGTQSAAPKAVVILMGTDGALISITGDDGLYSFPNLKPGEYDLSASFYAEPVVSNARMNGLDFATAADVKVQIGSTAVEQALTMVSIGQSGTAIEALAANYAWNGTSAFANTGAWIYDAVHSALQFEFPFRGNQGDFVGAFGQVNKFAVNFDPANPASSTIDVEVDLASVNTRTPGGRDNRTTVADNPSFNPLTNFTELGCIAGTFGITADNATPTDVAPQPITQDADRYAKFASASIEKYGNGYLAKGNLIFHGFTVPIELWFKAVPAWLDASNNRRYSGFEGKFLMDAKNDFGITSSSVNDAVLRIQISIVLYKQL